jgi:Domain of unknown function (DUF4395)
MRRLFSFPNPVNEVAARTVAAGVVVLCLLTLVLQTGWPLWILAYGFLARVLTGPTLSPLGQLAVRVIAPRVAPPHFVPGPPKRFAQGIGATLSVGALVAFYAGVPLLSWVFVAMIAVAALLESAFAVCLGCLIFGRLQALGLVPISVCEACNDVRSRYVSATS